MLGLNNLIVVMYVVNVLCRGMENMIKGQKDIIAELEAKIEANLDAINKVRT